MVAGPIGIGTLGGRYGFTARSYEYGPRQSRR